MLLEQGFYSMWAKSSLTPSFVYKVLLKHKLAHSFMCYLWWQSIKYLLSGPLQKKGLPAPYQI